MNEQHIINIKSGIYKILNTINGKFYVGSAVSIDIRKNRHFSHLRKNKHCNIKLQRSFNKHGEQNFIFEVLEIVEDKSKLIEREQHYLDILNPYYNICRKAGSSLGVKMSDESKKKMSEAFKGKTLSLETRKKISIARKNKFSPNQEIRNRISNTLKKYYEINDSPFKNKSFSIESKEAISNSLLEYYKNNESKNKNRKHTSEHREKNSNAKKEYYKNNPHPFLGKKFPGRNIKQYRPIIQINIIDNCVVKEWESITQAKLQFGASITCCLANKTKSAYGYKWKYKII